MQDKSNIKQDQNECERGMPDNRKETKQSSIRYYKVKDCFTESHLEASVTRVEASRKQCLY